VKNQEEIENLALNTVSTIRTLQAVGKDLQTGFSIEHQDVINVLDIIAANVIEIERLSHA